MVGHADVVLHVLEAARRDVGDRVLLAVDRALLQGQEQLLVGHLGRVGAQRLGVHQELRGVREPHPQAVEVAGLADRLVGGELAHAGRPRTQRVHPGLVLEPVEQVVGGVAVEEAGQVVAVVEGVRRVQHRHRLVDRTQGRGALDVHVDVAGDHRRDPVGVRAELAGREDLDGEADVGVGDLVGDHLCAAAVLGLGLGVAVGELERDVTAADSSPPPPPRCRRRRRRPGRAGGEEARRERRAPPGALVVSQCHHRFLSPVVSRAGSGVAAGLTATSSSKSRSIAARSADRPVKSSNASAAWWTAIPAPLSTVQPARGPRSAGRSRAGGRRCRRARGPVAAAPAVRASRVGRHPHRARVDQARLRGQRRPDRPGSPGPARPASGRPPGRPQRPRRGRVGVEDQQPAYPQLGQRMGDGGAGSARPQEHDPVAVDVREPVGERPEEAGDVGVVPDGPAVADQDRVERPDRPTPGRPRRPGAPSPACRVGDVETVEAQLDRRGQQPAQAVPVDGPSGRSMTL